MNKSNPKLFHGFSVVKGNEKTVIKISLDDDCKNGHMDFSLTADIYEKRGVAGGGYWRETGGGCCHEHILKLRPDLKIFADLHLSDQYGVPMHSFVNAFYWFAGCFDGGLGQAYHGGSGSHGKTREECMEIFIDYLRISTVEACKIFKLKPETSEMLQYYCEEMNLPARWRSQANEAIKILEMLSGKQWDHEYIPTRVRYNALSSERKAEIVKMIDGGYFSDEAKEQRLKQKAIDESDKRRKAILDAYESDIKELKDKMDIDLEMLRVGITENYIWYSHVNEISFNWNSSKKLISKEDFDKLESTLDFSKIPENVKLTYNVKPKY
jgi:hypothetical protein